MCTWLQHGGPVASGSSVNSRVSTLTTTSTRLWKRVTPPWGSTFILLGHKLLDGLGEKFIKMLNSKMLNSRQRTPGDAALVYR